MRARVAIQGWLPGGPELGMPSGARNRLLGLLRGLERLPERHDWDLTLFVSRHEEPDRELLDAVRCLPHARHIEIDVPARPTWRRVLGERRRASTFLRSFDLCELASLPVPQLDATSARRIHVVVHDLRDVGPFARGHFGARRVVATQSLRVAARRVDRFVVPSEPVADALRAMLHLEPDEVLLVPPGLEAPPQDCWPKPRFTDRPFVSLARPEPRKDLEFALSAWAESKRRDAQLPDLVFAGPPDRGWARIRRRVAALGVAASVHFVHDLRDDERWPLLATASALVFPSRLEGFGLPALEAALVRCPSIVRAGGVPHRVLRGATIAVEDGIDAWARALLEVARGSRTLTGGEFEAATRRYTMREAALSWVRSWATSLEGPEIRPPCRRAENARPAPSRGAGDATA